MVEDRKLPVGIQPTVTYKSPYDRKVLPLDIVLVIFLFFSCSRIRNLVAFGIPDEMLVHKFSARIKVNAQRSERQSVPDRFQGESFFSVRPSAKNHLLRAANLSVFSGGFSHERTNSFQEEIT